MLDTQGQGQNREREKRGIFLSRGNAFLVLSKLKLDDESKMTNEKARMKLLSNHKSEYRPVTRRVSSSS